MAFVRIHFRHIRIVSLVHCVVIIPLAFQALDYSALREDKVFGWDERAGTVFAVSFGCVVANLVRISISLTPTSNSYFLWDTIESIVHYQGVGFIAHGVSCSMIYTLAYVSESSFPPLFK